MGQTVSMGTYKWNIANRVARAALNLPEPLVQRLAGDPVERDGRVLNRGVQLLLSAMERLVDEEGAEPQSPQQRRKDFARSAAVSMPTITNLHVSERLIHLPETESAPAAPIRLRVYRRHDLGPTPPAITFFHGGGWVIGNLDSHDRTCRVLATHSRCVVIAVDYRLAPEFPFPTPLDDSLGAYEWITRNPTELSINPNAVAVMGDSAGGNLSAVVSLKARELEMPTPVAQGLVYPATDFRLLTESVDTFAEGFLLTRESMDWFMDHYLPAGVDKTQPDLSPLLAEDLSGAPPAWVWTGGFDPLRDEGRNYAEALSKAGVKVNHRCYDDQVHGFFNMGITPGGIGIIEEICTQMGDLVHSQL